MMLAPRTLSGIAKSLGARAQAATNVEAVLELAPEPTLASRAPLIAPKRRALLEPAPPQPSAKEHAERLLKYLRENTGANDGPITHAAILEFYTEMLIELGWIPRPWNPVAHQFRLLTTGNRKVYAWITTTTGAVHRLRVYPIPGRVVDAEPTHETTTKQNGSRSTPRLRRAA